MICQSRWHGDACTLEAGHDDKHRSLTLHWVDADVDDASDEYLRVRVELIGEAFGTVGRLVGEILTAHTMNRHGEPRKGGPL